MGTHSFLIGTFCNAGCTATFSATEVAIKYKGTKYKGTTIVPVQCTHGSEMRATGIVENHTTSNYNSMGKYWLPTVTASVISKMFCRIANLFTPYSDLMVTLL
jgi:monomeric isocitrate dehydrogenase